MGAGLLTEEFYQVVDSQLEAVGAAGAYHNVLVAEKVVLNGFHFVAALQPEERVRPHHGGDRSVGAGEGVAGEDGQPGDIVILSALIEDFLHGDREDT
jgi:hypothetical protein